MKSYSDQNKVLQERTHSAAELSSTSTTHPSLGTKPYSAIQKKQAQTQQMIAQSSQVKQLKAKQAVVLQKKNKTGMPDALKRGMEQLSGISMDDVKVNYNSARPKQLRAHAYAQGNQIHLAPGQERHLPHEAWHVVQQKQGRVKPTIQENGVKINDNVGLEKEADVMGQNALKKGKKG